MANSIAILDKLVLLFCFAAVGYFGFRKKWISKTGTAEISKLIVYIFNPLLMISTALSDSGSISSACLVQNVIAVILLHGGTILLGPLVARLLHIHGTSRAMLPVILTFANTGFMGIPLTKALFGAEYTIYISFYCLGYDLLFYTYGMYMFRRLAGDRSRFRYKDLLNPGIFSAVLAILIFAFKIRLPGEVTRVVDAFADVCVPLSMLVTGCALAQINFKSIFSDAVLYLYALIKLVLLSACAALLLRCSSALRIDAVVGGILVLQLGMPNGSMPVIACENFGITNDLCSRAFALTTILSVVTLPIVTMLI